MMMKNSFPFKSAITKEELAELPKSQFNGEMIYIDTFQNYERILPELKKENLFGFDTETRPNFKKGNKNPVSLLQLSTAEKAFIIRLNKIGLPDSLVQILSDTDVIKTGVAIRDDLAALKNLNPFTPQSFIELQEYVKYFGIEDCGLKKLTGNILGFRISKRQQTSNWEADILTDAQIEYAATDAWVCYEIYTTLRKTKPINGHARKDNFKIR